MDAYWGGRAAPLLLPKCHESETSEKSPGCPLHCLPQATRLSCSHSSRRQSWLHSALADRRKRASARAPRGPPGTFDVCLNTSGFGAGGKGRTSSSRWDPDGAARAGWPFRRDVTTSAPSPSGGCRIPSKMEEGACQDLPAHLDVGRLRTGLAEGAPASVEHVAILLALPGCRDGGMLLSSCGDGGMFLSTCRDVPAPCIPRAAAPKSPSLLVVSLSCASCRRGARGRGCELVAVKRLFNTAALIFLFVSVSVPWSTP